MSEHGLNKREGNGKSMGESSAKDKDKCQNLFSGIPGLERRWMKNCGRRICVLRVSRLEALRELTSSRSDIKLTVVMSDGRPLGDSARRMKMTKPALTSGSFPIQQSDSLSLAVNVNFYFQYFHNLKNNSDAIRILLQKRSKRSLVNKIIAECSMNLADIIQAPLEEGSVLMLHSTGRLKHTQKSVNEPIVRLHVQLESLPVDFSDISRWWPEVDDDNANERELILSGEDQASEDEEEDMLESEEDEDEWVERFDTVDEHGVDLIDEVEEDVFPTSNTIASTNIDRENGAKNFRSKVLKGTKKIASMTLTPVRVVRNQYARIRAKNQKEHASSAAVGDLEEEAGEDEAVFDDGVLHMAGFDRRASEDVGGEHSEVTARVESILSDSASLDGGSLVLLCNHSSSRGRYLYDVLTRRDSEARASTSQDLGRFCVKIACYLEIRAAVAVISAHLRKQQRQDRSAVMRIGILGGDSFLHLFLQEMLNCQAEPCFKIFLIPLGRGGRDSLVAQLISSKDSEYLRLFCSELWESSFEIADGEADFWMEAVETRVHELLFHYLSQAKWTFKLVVGEAFITCADSMTGSNPIPSLIEEPGYAGIVRQHTLPLISSLSVRAIEEVTTSGLCAAADPVQEGPSANSVLDVKLDFWVTNGGGEALKAVCMRSFKERNKRIRSSVNVTRNSGGGHVIRADVSRLICSAANPKANFFSVIVDGLRMSPVRFISISPHLSSTLINSLPIATFCEI
ncbi:hypothetical protein GUITHDRAFT_134763 [Guillardia theta CCMP2712]|uniref:Uncharacterized protein n=1 Tax=Guillardia theta (strain CCMP2712) TaxID=905079 RepID=L1JSN1_GUITC|nr:hypothetical protein GUITHDRAFT_134763 [Guillardia theta CCMP2712]EKX51279.1 hypothetical protein GUITHDRAFT_134763 [Guillardia theta CCMP2712]|eukprot:XP_005838259.1 hypothetical protein GUITHDRAFT_134763 [Guillardia theta CCMP2712]